MNDLRPASAGVNVAILAPFDDVVFERTSTKGGVAVAARSQVAADMLTSPGRGPNEGEALLQWMQENEDAWRAGNPEEMTSRRSGPRVGESGVHKKPSIVRLR